MAMLRQHHKRPGEGKGGGQKGGGGGTGGRGGQGGSGCKVEGWRRQW